MAKFDYRCCDVCDGKVFYDANLDYEAGPSKYREQNPYKVNGEHQHTDAEFNNKYGQRLGYLGDWAVICEDCAKTHKCVVVPINEGVGDDGELFSENLY